MFTFLRNVFQTEQATAAHTEVTTLDVPLLWFHADGSGDDGASVAVALPLIFRALLEYGERVRVCVTVTRAEDLQLLRPLLPPRPAADIRLLPPDSRRDVALFLSDARPAAGVLFESPVHPATVLAAAAARVPLALLSASIPGHDLISWNGEPAARRVLERVLACFSLIVPQTDADTARLRILGATLEQMPGWCGDLRYAAAVGPGVYGGAASWRPATAQAARKLVAGRQAWLAAMTVAGEEAAVARVHCAVTRACSSAKAAAAVAAGGRSSGTGSSDTAPPPTPTTPLLTLIAPDDSSRCTDVLQALQAAGLTAELWSAACQRLLMSPDSPQQQQQGQQQEKGTEQLGASTPGAACSPSSLDAATAAGHAPPPPAATAVPSPPLSCDVVDVIVVDDLGALSALYSEVEIALLGNSLLPGCSGQSLGEAAVAACAVLVGRHVSPQMAAMADDLNAAALTASAEATAIVNGSGVLLLAASEGQHHGSPLAGGTQAAAAAAAAAALRCSSYVSGGSRQHQQGQGQVIRVARIPSLSRLTAAHGGVEAQQGAAGGSSRGSSTAAAAAAAAGGSRSAALLQRTRSRMGVGLSTPLTAPAPVGRTLSRTTTTTTTTTTSLGAQAPAVAASLHRQQAGVPLPAESVVGRCPPEQRRPSAELTSPNFRSSFLGLAHTAAACSSSPLLLLPAAPSLLSGGLFAGVTPPRNPLRLNFGTDSLCGAAAAVTPDVGTSPIEESSFLRAAAGSMHTPITASAVRATYPGQLEPPPPPPSGSSTAISRQLWLSPMSQPGASPAHNGATSSAATTPSSTAQPATPPLLLQQRRPLPAPSAAADLSFGSRIDSLATPPPHQQRRRQLSALPEESAVASSAELPAGGCSVSDAGAANIDDDDTAAARHDDQNAQPCPAAVEDEVPEGTKRQQHTSGLTKGSSSLGRTIGRVPSSAAASAVSSSAKLLPQQASKQQEFGSAAAGSSTAQRIGGAAGDKKVKGAASAPPPDFNSFRLAPSSAAAAAAAAAAADAESPRAGAAGHSARQRDAAAAPWPPPCASSSSSPQQPRQSFMRYSGEYLLSAAQIVQLAPGEPGPAVWHVADETSLARALLQLLRDPLERRSRGHAAAQGAAKLAHGLTSTVWQVLDGRVLAPSLMRATAASFAASLRP